MTERIILKLKPSDGIDVIYGWHPDFEVVSDIITKHTRWSVEHEVIVRRKVDGLFFRSYYSEGATESQDESPYEYCDYAEFSQVMSVERVVIAYEWWDSSNVI